MPLPNIPVKICIDWNLSEVSNRCVWLRVMGGLLADEAGP